MKGDQPELTHESNAPYHQGEKSLSARKCSNTNETQNVMGFESVLSLEKKKVLGNTKYDREKQWDDKTKLRQLSRREGGRGMLPGRCTEGT